MATVRELILALSALPPEKHDATVLMSYDGGLGTLEWSGELDPEPTYQEDNCVLLKEG